jgi:amidase
MARTVKDAAILLGILAGIDSIQLLMKVRKRTDYTKFLDAKALQGKDRSGEKTSGPKSVHA